MLAEVNSVRAAEHGDIRAVVDHQRAPTRSHITEAHSALKQFTIIEIRLAQLNAIGSGFDRRLGRLEPLAIGTKRLAQDGTDPPLHAPSPAESAVEPLLQHIPAVAKFFDVRGEGGIDGFAVFFEGAE